MVAGGPRRGSQPAPSLEERDPVAEPERTPGGPTPERPQHPLQRALQRPDPGTSPRRPHPRLRVPLAPGPPVLVPGAVWTRLRAWVVLDAFERELRTVHVVGGGERFDPYRVVREARRAGHRPRDVLATSRVARAFTAAQLATLLHDRLEPELHGAHALTVSDPLDLLLTDEVTGAEAAVLLSDLLDLLVEVGRTVPVLLTQRAVAPADEALGPRRRLRTSATRPDRTMRTARALAGMLREAVRPAAKAVEGVELPAGAVWWGTTRQATLDAYRFPVEA